MSYIEKLVASTEVLPREFWLKLLDDCIDCGALRKTIDRSRGCGFAGGRTAGELFFVLTQPDDDVWTAEIAAAIQMDAPYWLIDLSSKIYHSLPLDDAEAFAKWVVSTVPSVDKIKAKSAYIELVEIVISSFSAPNKQLLQYAAELKRIINLPEPDTDPALSYYKFSKRCHTFIGHVTPEGREDTIKVIQMYPNWYASIPLYVDCQSAIDLSVKLKNLLN